MSARFLTNAFSLNMLPENQACSIQVSPALSLEDALALAEGAESAIGHADLAAILEGLGFNAPVNRQNIVLEAGETALIAQYVGPRLPEGTTQLPQGAQIVFRAVTRVE